MGTREGRNPQTGKKIGIPAKKVPPFAGEQLREAVDPTSGPDAGWKSIESSETNVQRVGWDTFRRELPQLLQEHPGKWVAFHGEGQVALSASKREVYEQLKQVGCPLDEVVVRRIELLGPQVVDLRRPRRVLGPSDRREA